MKFTFSQLRKLCCVAVLASLATTGCMSPFKSAGADSGTELSSLHGNMPEPVYGQDDRRNYDAYAPNESNQGSGSRNSLARFRSGSC